MVVGEKGRVIVGACDKRPDTLEKPAASEFVLKTGDGAVERFTLKWLAHFGLSGFGGFLFLLVELLLQACELSLGVHRELTVLDPGEVGRLGLIYLPGRVALVLSETDGRLVVLAENQSAGIVNGAWTAGDSGQELDIVLENLLVVLCRSLVHIQLALKHFICSHSVSLG